jgi:hypothetical protein
MYTMGQYIQSIILLFMLIGLYGLPITVAFGRGHHQRWAIVIVDIFLGWTFLGWVIALTMSCSRVKEV